MEKGTVNSLDIISFSWGITLSRKLVMTLNIFDQNYDEVAYYARGTTPRFIGSFIHSMHIDERSNGDSIVF